MSVLLYTTEPFIDVHNNGTGIVAHMLPQVTFERYIPPFAAPAVGRLIYRADMSRQPQEAGGGFNSPVLPVYLSDAHFNQINVVGTAVFRNVDLGLKVPEVGQ